jgi:flavin reductase (DIM6/NTAB) family NADH-FMN oxidoreductase RutF
MNGGDGPIDGGRLIRTDGITKRDRYQLLTSLVLPRPIGWVSTRSANGMPNLAPFSYFAALSATPMLIGLSIGSRRGSPKDTLSNIVETGAFCVNIVTGRHLHAMNESAGEHRPEVDEFEVAGVHAAEAELVAAPYVEDCPAVFECRLYREVDLGDSDAMLVIGEVLGVRLSGKLAIKPGTWLVDPEDLRPVARLGGNLYTMLGEVVELARPVVEDGGEGKG